jgi:hypothetical protein
MPSAASQAPSASALEQRAQGPQTCFLESQPHTRIASLFWLLPITLNNQTACTYPFIGSLQDGDHKSLYSPVTKWSGAFVRIRHPSQVLFTPGMRHLGFGQPFANAAKLCRPERQVTNIAGDGGFGCTLQELETAVRYSLNVINVISITGPGG